MEFAQNMLLKYGGSYFKDSTYSLSRALLSCTSSCHIISNNKSSLSSLFPYSFIIFCEIVMREVFEIFFFFGINSPRVQFWLPAFVSVYCLQGHLFYHCPKGEASARRVPATKVKTSSWHICPRFVDNYSPIGDILACFYLLESAVILTLRPTRGSHRI